MTYQDLINKWGEYADRSKMPLEEELQYIQDWYEVSKDLPTKPFEPNYSEYAKYKGQNFTVIDPPVSYVLDDVDIESLPMWKIQLECGEIIWADCDEIFEIKP